MAILVKLVTFLLGAAVATAAIIPDQELGGLAVTNTSNTSALKGGFIPYCCKNSNTADHNLFLKSQRKKR